MIPRNLAKTLLVLAPDMLFLCGDYACDIVSAKKKKKCEQGEGFVKFCCVKKTYVGDGRELERMLDDVFGI